MKYFYWILTDVRQLKDKLEKFCEELHQTEDVVTNIKGNKLGQVI